MLASVAPAAADAVDLRLQAEDRRALRFAERRKLWRISQVRKLRTCGRGVRDETVDVLVTRDAEGNARGATAGLVTCSSVWSCPVCAEHIRTARGVEIAEAFRRWTSDELGGGLVFVTLTLRHKRTDSLADLLGALMKAWRRVQQTSGWRSHAAALKIAGWIRSIEVTYGTANGWHPHLHLYLFVDRPLSRSMRDALEDFLTSAWLRETGKDGFAGIEGIAVDVRRVDADATKLEQLAAYAAKPEQLHLEATRGHRKGDPDADRWAPMDLIDAAADGEVWALRAWHEFEVSTNGRRAIEWSRGLRDRLGLGDEVEDQELTDDAVADDADEVEVVATLDAAEWVTIARAGLDYEVLTAAVHGGEAGVRAVVRQAGRVPRNWWRRCADRGGG